MKIELVIPKEAEAAHRRLRDDAGVLAALARRMDDLNDVTVSYIQEHELKGPRPEKLGVRTAHLWQSIRRTKSLISGGAVVSSIGSNIKYLRPHEFGFEGDVQVRPFTRKSSLRLVIVGKRRRRVRGGEVKGHKRHLRIKARAPLKTGVEARREQYREGLGQAFGEFYKGKR